MSLTSTLKRLLCQPGTREILSRIERLERMEITMSALTDAVDRLTASVDAAGDRFTNLVTPLQTALTAAQEQVAALQVDDDADKAAIEASLAEANTAAARLLEEADQLDRLGTPVDAPAPPPPAPPVVPEEG